MDTKFNLLKTANDRIIIERYEDAAIVANITAIAESTGATVDFLHESVTHLLANIATAAHDGKPIRLMHLNSIAAFMAGVDAITQALPNSQDPTKKQNTIRALSVAGIASDGMINDATFPIIEVGARREDLKSKYVQMLKDYVLSREKGNPQGTIVASAARKLQMAVDRAMRSIAKPRSFANAGPGAATGGVPT
jgi:hypothetical protein